MPGDASTLAAVDLDGVALLERAVAYLLGSLRVVGTADLDLPTPCREWDLGDLLAHLNESLIVLEEAALGEVAIRAGWQPVRVADPVSELRRRAGRLLGAWTTCSSARTAVGGLPLPASVVSSAGALEIAVHGWDIRVACGAQCGLPEPLAVDLLSAADTLVTDADRPGRFGRPSPVSPWCSPSARLLAHLGRTAW